MRKKESQAKIAHGAISVKTETVRLEKMDTVAPAVLFQEPPTQVSFFAKPTYNAQVWNEVNKSVPYSTTCLADKGARTVVTNEAFRSPQCKRHTKRDHLSELHSGIKRSLSMYNVSFN